VAKTSGLGDDLFVGGYHIGGRLGPATIGGRGAFVGFVRVV
jgi:hypothetical protein